MNRHGEIDWRSYHSYNITSQSRVKEDKNEKRQTNARSENLWRRVQTEAQAAHVA